MAMERQDYEVIVVGAGIGGVVCSALLARRGVRTLLVDQNPVAGGKAMTVANQGYAYEYWPVAGGPALNSVFEDVSAELGVSDAIEMIVPSDNIRTLYRASSGELRTHVGSSRPGAPGGSLGGLSVLGLEDTGFMEVLRLLTDINSLDDESIRALDEVSFLEFLSAYELPQAVISYFGIQANVIFVVPIDRLAASEMIRVMRDFGKGGAGRYHRGGFGRIAELYARSVEDNGGEVLLSTRVDEIVVSDGHVSGVRTSAGEFSAKVVVSNAGIQPTVLKLVGANGFEQGYVDWVKSLVPSEAIIGHRYFLSEPVFTEGMLVYYSDATYVDSARFEGLRRGEVPEDLPVFCVVPAVYDEGLAPPGKQCALVGTFCPADPDLPVTRALLDKLDEVALGLWPMSDCIESKVSYATRQVSDLTRDAVLPGQGGECIGLAQIVGQCGDRKPSARSPLPGLYYVGCDAGGYGCGTHQAADSGVKVTDLVLGDLAALAH